jgi:type I restriction enzyme R subunit
LVGLVALGVWDVDTLTSLAGRLARVDRELGSDERKEIEAASGGKPLKQIINGLFDAVDPDKHVEKAKQLFKTETPTAEQVKKASFELAKSACALFNTPLFRGTLIEVKQRNDQIIDTTSIDKVVFAGHDPQAAQKARLTVKSFRDFIEHNKDELIAIQLIYNRPYGQRHLTYEAIKELSDAIKKPPYNLTPELVWMAYQQLEKAKVKDAGPQKLLTNIVSLVRFATGKADVLEPFGNFVDYRFNDWLIKQAVLGRRFTPEQKEWLNMIKAHITTSLNVTLDDLENVPFNQKGGAVKAYQLFGKELNQTLEELNTVLTK